MGPPNADAQKRSGISPVVFEVWWRRYLANRTGAAAAEFALVLPVLALLLLGIIKFGIVFSHYIQLTNAASAGARQLSISRGAPTPFTLTRTAIENAAPNLAPGSMTKTMTVGGVACTSDGADCQQAFGAGGSAVLAQVNLTYPCDLTIFTFSLSCRLASSSSGLVQ